MARFFEKRTLSLFIGAITKPHTGTTQDYGPTLLSCLPDSLLRAYKGPLRTLHILFLASICLCFLSEFRPVLIEVLKYGCAELVGVALIEGFIRGLFGGRGPMRFWRTARFAFSAWIVLTATHRDWIYVAKLALANHAIGRLLFAISSVWADWECRKTTETASTGST